MSYLKTVRLPLGILLLSTIAGCEWYTTAVRTGIDVGTMLAADRSLYNVADDFAIKSEITEAIFDEALLLTVSTDVYQGMVMLTGTVKDSGSKKQAEKLARRVSGVREVFNELQVTDGVGITATVGDLVIENKLKAYLFLAQGVSSINFRWRAVNGVVYFMGVAKSRKELDKVLSVAHLNGVTKIITHIFLSDQFVVEGPSPSPVEEKVTLGKNDRVDRPEVRPTKKKALIEPEKQLRPSRPPTDGVTPEMPTYFERRIDQLY
jgi:osmotically-inducible protein OsmY